MNISWIVAGIACLITGFGRSYAYFSGLAGPLREGGVPAIIANWFPTVWFIVSGVFLLGAVAYLTIGLNPRRFASNQIAVLISSMFLITAGIIGVVNVTLVDVETLRPMTPLAVIVFFGFFGLRSNARLNQRTDDV